MFYYSILVEKYVHVKSLLPGVVTLFDWSLQHCLYLHGYLMLIRVTSWLFCIIDEPIEYTLSHSCPYIDSLIVVFNIAFTYMAI